MITLTKAFKLCGIGAESVYLQAASDTHRIEFFFWSTKLREVADMKKLKVVGIYPKIDVNDGEFKGMVFVVRGMSRDELDAIRCKAMLR